MPGFKPQKNTQQPTTISSASSFDDPLLRLSTYTKKRISHYFAGGAVLILIFLAGRFSVFSQLMFIREIDEFALLLLFIVFCVYSRVFSKGNVRYPRLWFIVFLWLFICNLTWNVILARYGTKEIYSFHIFFNYILIVLGFSALKDIRIRINKLFQKFQHTDGHIEQEQYREFQKEQKRKKTFFLQFPFLSRIPLIGDIALWIYKEGLFYIVGILVSLAIFTLLSFFDGRMSYSIQGDELHHTNTAVGLLKTGKLEQWDWFVQSGFRSYTRAEIVTYLVAIMFKFFGMSEIFARLPMFFTGFLLIIIGYVGVKTVTRNKPVALAFGVWLATSPFIIYFTTLIRDYIFYIFATCLFYFIFFKVFDERKKKLQLLYAVLSVALLYIIYFSLDKSNFLIAYPAIVLVPVIGVYERFLKNASDKAKILFSIGSGMVIFCVFLFVRFNNGLFNLYRAYTRPFGYDHNFLQISFLGTPYKIATTLIIIIALGFFINRRKRITQMNNGFTYFFIFFAFSQFIMAFLLNAGSLGYHARYISHVIMLNFLLLVICCYILIEMFIKKKRTTRLFILLGITLMFNIILSSKEKINVNGVLDINEYHLRHMYTRHRIEVYHSPDFPKVSAVLEKNITPQTILIDGGLTDHSFNFRNVQINPKNYYTFCFTTDLYAYQTICDQKDNSLEWKHIKKFVKEHPNNDIVIMWLKRKDYKISKDIKENVPLSGFEKISGTGLDDSNVEIYKIQKGKFRENAELTQSSY